jgi:hypothetical protein
MLPTLRVLASAITLLLPYAAPRAHTSGAPLRILWVGNSYTYVNELPRIIAQLAQSSKVDRPPAIIGVTPREARRAQEAARKVLALGK